MSAREIVVRRIDTGREEAAYVGISAAEAVMAAHAQSLGDFETWNYSMKYSGMVRSWQNGVRCGEFCADVPDEG